MFAQFWFVLFDQISRSKLGAKPVTDFSDFAKDATSVAMIGPQGCLCSISVNFADASNEDRAAWGRQPRAKWAGRKANRHPEEPFGRRLAIRTPVAGRRAEKVG